MNQRSLGLVTRCWLRALSVWVFWMDLLSRRLFRRDLQTGRIVPARPATFRTGWSRDVKRVGMSSWQRAMHAMRWLDQAHTLHHASVALDAVGRLLVREGAPA